MLLKMQLVLPNLVHKQTTTDCTQCWIVAFANKVGWSLIFSRAWSDFWMIDNVHPRPMLRIWKEIPNSTPWTWKCRIMRAWELAKCVTIPLIHKFVWCRIKIVHYLIVHLMMYSTVKRVTWTTTLRDELWPCEFQLTTVMTKIIRISG